GAAGADERNPGRSNRFGLRVERNGLVLRSLRIAERYITKGFTRPTVAHQIAHQRSDIDQPAAVIAQVDNQLSHALRLEVGKGRAEVGLRSVDKCAQVKIADPTAAIEEYFRSEERR